MAAKKTLKLVRVEMLKDFNVDDRHIAKKGKYGSFTEDVAAKMIKAGAAKEIVNVNSIDDITNKKPYIEVLPEPNPTEAKQAAANEPPKKKGPTTKEEKNFKVK